MSAQNETDRWTNRERGARPVQGAEAPTRRAVGDASGAPTGPARGTWAPSAPLPERASYLARTEGPNLNTAAFEEAHRSNALRLHEGSSKGPTADAQEPEPEDSLDAGQPDLRRAAHLARRDRVFQSLDDQSRRQRTRARRESQWIGVFLFLVFVGSFPSPSSALLAGSVAVGLCVGVASHRFGDHGVSWLLASAIGIATLAPFGGGSTTVMLGLVLACAAWLVGYARQFE